MEHYYSAFEWRKGVIHFAHVGRPYSLHAGLAGFVDLRGKLIFAFSFPCLTREVEIGLHSLTTALYQQFIWFPIFKLAAGRNNDRSVSCGSFVFQLSTSWCIDSNLICLLVPVWSAARTSAT